MSGSGRYASTGSPPPPRGGGGGGGGGGAKAGRDETLGESVRSLPLVRRIAARPSIVFKALTTPDGIASWWGPDDGPVLLAETDVRGGGRFRGRVRVIDG